MLSHTELVLLAEKWLVRQNCGVVFREPFRAWTSNGERPDAIGWRHSVSILIECKTSRADFLADRNKKFRAAGAQALGDWRFFLCPKGLIKIEELAEGWGLLYEQAGRVYAMHGMPFNSHWGRHKPFTSAKEIELQIFYSALRRMELRGHLAAVYEPMIGM